MLKIYKINLLIIILVAVPTLIQCNDIIEKTSPNSGVSSKSGKGKYYVCPPDFIRLANNCYYLSDKKTTWQDAHYACKEKMAELVAMEKPYEDRHIRKYLNRSPNLARHERWTSGFYNWIKNAWTWATTSKKIEYSTFTRTTQGETNLQWECIVLDPEKHYKWSHRSCVKEKHFICEMPLKKVSMLERRELKELRKTWNITNPSIHLNVVSIPEKTSNKNIDYSNYYYKTKNNQNVKSETTTKPKELKKPEHKKEINWTNNKTNSKYGINKNNFSLSITTNEIPQPQIDLSKNKRKRRNKYYEEVQLCRYLMKANFNITRSTNKGINKKQCIRILERHEKKQKRLREARNKRQHNNSFRIN